MKVTIVGGGNIGTQFAVHCAEKGHDVFMYTSRPELFSDTLKIVDENGRTTKEGVIRLATYDPAKAFPEAEWIMITMPPNVISSVSEDIYTFASDKAVIGVVPGNGGCECAFKRLIERGNTFFGIERVPAIARLVKKGEIVQSTGYRNELHISALPCEAANSCCDLIESVFDMPCKVIPNYMNLTLTPSNPILHTTRLYSLFKDYKDGKYYDNVPLFYEEWDDYSSELLMECDFEVQKICKALPELELKHVKSLRDHYESYTVAEMTKKISSIDSFKGLPSPVIRSKEGFIPDLHSRYFTADFSFGLAVIQQVAIMANVKTPVIDSMKAWYNSIKVEEKEISYEMYGITNKKQLLEFYRT